MLEKGLVQIYTGNGKGKTTAALGLALRAQGYDNKVLVYQFLKPPSLKLGERISTESTSLDIEIESLDLKWDMDKSFGDSEKVTQAKAAIKQALEKIMQLAKQKIYNVIILDEIVFCLSMDLADLEDIKALIDNKHTSVELVLTGSGATDELIELADLVTEMKCIKHPFENNISARRGIEF